MDANERMPGDAEAAAAIAGMQDVYGRTEHAVGDLVTFRLTEWTAPKQGRIDAVDEESGNYLILAESRTYLVMPEEIGRP